MVGRKSKLQISVRLILLIVLPVLFLLLLTFLNSKAGTEIKSDLNIKGLNIPVGRSTQINPQKEYKNPFNKDTQYVNPFSEYKNPFDR